jgi:2-dehydro-3-deoxyphosphooctonate aldolase (KDO 8-P synthase)
MQKSREIFLTQSLKAGDAHEPVFIMGPCVIESEDTAFKIAASLKDLSVKKKFKLVFKASFDKANRTSIKSFRGVGIDEGMRIFDKIKHELELPVITDVHETCQIDKVSQVVDIIQIPAFLVRQTDLVEKAARTGKCLNLKKGQFLSPWEMKHVVNKVEETGNTNYFITERGTFFGYNRLVNDFKYFPYLKELAPLCFDGTHSVQLPGSSSSTAGEPQYIENLSLAACASGCDLFFFETHFSREESKSDSSNLVLLSSLPALLDKLILLSAFMRQNIF